MHVQFYSFGFVSMKVIVIAKIDLHQIGSIVMAYTSVLALDEQNQCIPYTAKLSRGKTFAVFAVLHPTTNVLRRIVN